MANSLKGSFRHLLKSSASLYESGGSQFFRTTGGIQSETDSFNESRLIMTFFTSLGVTEILYSLRLYKYYIDSKKGNQVKR